jgi:hypothetical protein
MDFRRNKPVMTQLNELELTILQFLSQRQARTESETIRELIRKAGDDAGFFSELAKAAAVRTLKVEDEELSTK